MTVGGFASNPLRRLAGLVAVALVGAACISSGETSGSKTSQAGQAGQEVKPIVAKDPTEPTTVTFQSWVGDSPQMKKFAAAFQKEHPNITIKFQNVPTGRATDKLITQVAGGNAPDVAFMDTSAVEDFSSRNALVNLDGYVAGSEIVEENDYVEGFKNGVEFEGSMFGLPYDGETTGLFYRTDMFEKAGIDEPPTTWEEFEEAARKLTDPAEKTYGYIVFAPEAAYYWYPWLWQAGGTLLSDDGKSVAFDSPEGQQAAEFYAGLSKYSPPDYLNLTSWDGRVAFATGKVAMYMAGTWFGGQMETEFPDISGKWDVAALPEGPAGCGTTLAGDTLAILDQAENHDAAWLWIEFLSSKENMKAWTFGSKETTLLPPRQSLLDDPELGKFNPWMEGFADSMKCAVTDNITQPAWPQIEETLNEHLGEALYGDIPGDEAVKESAKRGEELIQTSNG